MAEYGEFLGIRVPPELMQRIVTRQKAERRSSRSEMVRILIEDGLEVEGLVRKARYLSAEATLTPHPIFGGEPQPDFTIDPETLAELDTALAKFEHV